MIPEGIRYYKVVTAGESENMFGIQYESDEERAFLRSRTTLAPYDHRYERTYIGMDDCIVEAMEKMDAAGFTKTGTSHEPVPE